MKKKKTSQVLLLVLSVLVFSCFVILIFCGELVAYKNARKCYAEGEVVTFAEGNEDYAGTKTTIPTETTYYNERYNDTSNPTVTREELSTDIYVTEGDTVEDDNTSDTVQITEYIATTDNSATTEDTVFTEYIVSTESSSTTEHTHSYVMTSSCCLYPEEGHYESVCVSEGYVEEIYEYYDYYCYYCGTVLDGWSLEDLLDHSSMHGAYGSYQKVVDTVWHEPVYEEVWIVDKEEYYEEEVVIECIECGYREVN